MRRLGTHNGALALMLIGLTACASASPARQLSPQQVHFRRLLEHELQDDDGPRMEEGAAAQWVRGNPGSEKEVVALILLCRPRTCDEQEELIAASALELLGATNREMGRTLSRRLLEDAASVPGHVRQAAAYQLVSSEQHQAMDVLLLALEQAPDDGWALISPIIMAASAGSGSDPRVVRAIAVMEKNRERATDEERRRLIDNQIRRLKEVLPGGGGPLRDVAPAALHRPTGT